MYAVAAACGLRVRNEALVPHASRVSVGPSDDKKICSTSALQPQGLRTVTMSRRWEVSAADTVTVFGAVRDSDYLGHCTKDMQGILHRYGAAS